MTTVDHPGFLADIIAHPEDDALRLIYADWLEDHGQPEWAEFIRVQVELDPDDRDNRRTQERLNYLRQRERELLNETTYRYRRNGHWERSWGCYVWGPPQSLWHLNSKAWTFRRGFVVEIHAPLQTLLDHLPAVVRRHPVEVVRATDRAPDSAIQGVNGWWDVSWYEEKFEKDPEDLPSEIFSLLDGFTTDEDEPGWKFYSTQEAAQAALSSALLTWAKGKE